MKEHLLDFLEELPYADTVLIKGYEDGRSSNITAKIFREKVFRIASFLKNAGVSAQDRIAVIAEKCPETIACFFGIWLNGAIAVPVCETLSKQELSFIVNNADTKLVLASSSLREDIAEALSGAEVIYDFSAWTDIPFGAIDESTFVVERAPDAIAFLLYTSGSTGRPKGVMLSHRNIAVNAVVGAEYIGLNSTDAVLSILPYWHSFAITAEIFSMLHVGGKIFIPKNRKTLLKDIALFRPTVVLSVPRVAEMLKDGIETSVRRHPSFVQRLFASAQRITLRYYLTRPESRTLFIKALYRIVRRTVFRTVKESFGGRLRYFIGGGAPLAVHLQEFFFSIDIPMYQGYGLTEASPVISVNAPHGFKIGTSGKMIPWILPDYGGDYTFEDQRGFRGKHLKGELLVKGACVMKGYWDMEDEGAQLSEDGWLKTGDMGYIDKDGFLVLYGRRKNLICLKGGEKFYPEVIEERLKVSPYILNAMVIGEGCARPYVLINSNGELLEGCSSSEIDTVISREIRKATKHLDLYQRPVRHLILPEFTVEASLLTTTLKLKRHEIKTRYQRQITQLMIGAEELVTMTQTEPAEESTPFQAKNQSES
ncbi:MAG: AMP-binding protein [Candidatus Omnitrophica bacterium]|nr:AMP-binding protein [Candidatus Omnitrophota bacterium]